MDMKTWVASKGFQQACKYIGKDPETNIPKLMELVDKFAGDSYQAQRDAIRKVVNDPDSNWFRLICSLWEDVDSEVLCKLFSNFIINANFYGWDIQEKARQKYGCNIPWAILMDPTSACNLHCTGCWAAEYGNKLNLSLEELDDIICQGRDMGVYFYIYTGGEPLVRKKDLITLCERHPDCEFLSFTNGTLIDEAFADEMLRVKNFIPAISLEGDETTTDSRRGAGTYQKVMHAIELLHERKLIYGISSCYTSVNWDAISSREYFQKLIDLGCLFIWYFHYMPVGNDASPELLPTPEQRRAVLERIRHNRATMPLFAMDFQNDAQYVGGCIAGGRRYLHINANGDMDPCVFIHYSDSNIREKTLLEAMRSPLFMAYHNGQPFNDNMLRPCPMLENPEKLRRIVADSGAHSTDPMSPETAEHLCSKCDGYAACWAPVAEQLWRGSPDEAKYLAKQAAAAAKKK